MDEQRADPIIEYSRMIGKNTAELTASDMSKFMKWWMGQPIREDLVDMRKKKQIAKKSEVKKPLEVKKETVKTKAIPLAKTTKKEVVNLRKSDIVTITLKGGKSEVKGTQGGRFDGKKGAIKEASKGGFDRFREKKEEQRRQVKAIPTPSDIDQLDEDIEVVVDELEEGFKNRIEEDDVENVEVEDPEEMSEDEIEEFIEENVEGSEEVVEEEVVEEEVVAEGPEVIAVNMGLNVLDVEALGYVLDQVADGVLEVPEEYVVSLDSILQGLRQ